MDAYDPPVCGAAGPGCSAERVRLSYCIRCGHPPGRAGAAEIQAENQALFFDSSDWGASDWQRRAATSFISPPAIHKRLQFMHAEGQMAHGSPGDLAKVANECAAESGEQ